MKPSLANLLNAVILIVISLWAYFSSETPSGTAFIPVGFGVVFLLCSKAFNGGNKAVVHLVILLTLVVAIALVKPLSGALGREDTMGAIQVSLMIISSVASLVIYIRSFIQARRNR